MWIVTWVITTWLLVGCPSVPTADEFGRTSVQMTITAQCCWKQQIEEKQKCFTKKEDALAFIAQGEKEIIKQGDFQLAGGVYLSDFKLFEQKEN